MSDRDGTADIAAMSFEEALAELEEIVKELERGETDLDQAISVYERGMRLKQHCETKLRQAQEKVDRIMVDADGAIRAEPSQADDEPPF